MSGNHPILSHLYLAVHVLNHCDRSLGQTRSGEFSKVRRLLSSLFVVHRDRRSTHALLRCSVNIFVERLSARGARSANVTPLNSYDIVVSRPIQLPFNSAVRKDTFICTGNTHPVLNH